MRPNMMRDTKITTGLLNGITLGPMSKKYSLSKTRITQILHESCCRNNKEAYINGGNGSREELTHLINPLTNELESQIVLKPKRPLMEYLRENKDMFMGDGRL